MPDPLSTAKPCPICRRPATEPRFRPFCSARCADVDLGRWFNGAYAIPGPAPEFDDDPPANQEN
ncbi:MAG: DNA gyrase inhibitor YacG [Janthinobacterium lividum]